MKDRNLFMETLREVKEIVRTAGRPLSRDEIMEYFKDTELTKEQEAMVIEYLYTEDEVKTEEEPSPEVEENVEPVQEESKIFGMYMEELNGLTVYSDTELSMMYVKLLQGDESVINRICNSFMKRVVEIAGEYKSYGIEDVIQEGNMALYLELVKLCGCNQPVDVEEALDMAVREGISNYISDIAGENDIEQTVIGKVNLINEAIKLLKMEKGEDPSLEELASYTGLLEDELSDIMEIIKKADKR